MFELPPEVVKLLEAAACHPEGDAALFEGHLESVAALYQVHPQTVEQLRACLEQPGGRARAVEIVARARLNPGARVDVPVKPAPSVTALIARATALPNGLELLTQGPIETAAVQLDAHPFAVDEARQRLAGADDDSK